MGTVAQPVKKVVTPSTSTLTLRTVRAPYLSTAQPVAGDKNVDANPPALAAPARTVRLHPRSSAMGYIKTAKVKLAAALRTTCVEPDVARMTQP